MKNRNRGKLCAFLGVIALAGLQPAAADELCASLRRFIASVQPGTSHSLAFHTMWGGNFKGRTEPAFAAKRCDYQGYTPATEVCAYLMKYGDLKFPGNNAKEVIRCLSPQTRFAENLALELVTLSLTYGSAERASKIEIEVSEDAELGGMRMSITAGR